MNQESQWFSNWPQQGLFSEIKTERVDLGKGLTGAVALPATKDPRPAVIIIMETFGLNDFVLDVVRLFAHEGYVALAPDIFHGDIYDYENIGPALTHLSSLNDVTVMDEIGSGIHYLSRHPNVLKSSIGVVGFCMGGRLSFLSMASYPEQLKAGVCFYPGSLGIEGKDRLGREGVLEKASSIRHPVLLLYGAEDPSILPSEHARITQRMGDLKKEYVMAAYPGAGHGFFNGRRGSYHLASAQKSWMLARTFLESCFKNPSSH